MPSLKMKNKSSTGCITEKYSLHVCLKSSVISKKSCSHDRISQQTAESDTCTESCHDGSSSMEVSTLGFNCHESIEQQDEECSQLQKQPPIFVDSTTIGRMDSAHTSSSNLETIFSPVLESIEVLGEPSIDYHAVDSMPFSSDVLIYNYGSDEDPIVPGLEADDNRSSCDYQTCNVSDFFISDMIVTGLPFDENAVDVITDSNPFSEYKCAGPSMLFDVADQYIILPFLEDTTNSSNIDVVKSYEQATMDPNNASLYLAIEQMKSCNHESDSNFDSDQADHFDPQLFIKTLPELSDVVSNFRPTVLPDEARRRKPVTLVLDLDETLVHSTLEHCDDADFTFTVFFNMEEHTVYVKQRPHLQTFLERVAEMFEIVIFTASQSIYAAQLLDILDPDGKLISRRVYRESCIFSDGSYTKDLTVLGLDLAKVAIIDNSPQVFRLQVNNGIPIKSWFSDASDCALISLLPFLETLADAEDVRPIIAKRFGYKE